MLDQILSEDNTNVAFREGAESQAQDSLCGRAGEFNTCLNRRSLPRSELFSCSLEAGPSSSITGEKDARLFLPFVRLKSCALHPFYRCLQGAADRARLCTTLWLWLWLLAGPTGAQGCLRVVQQLW